MKNDDQLTRMYVRPTRSRGRYIWLYKQSHLHLVKGVRNLELKELRSSLIQVSPYSSNNAHTWYLYHMTSQKRSLFNSETNISTLLHKYHNKSVPRYLVRSQSRRTIRLTFEHIRMLNFGR